MNNRLVSLGIISMFLLTSLTIASGEIGKNKSPWVENWDKVDNLNDEENVLYSIADDFESRKNNIFSETINSKHDNNCSYCYGLIMDEYQGNQEPLVISGDPPPQWDWRDAVHNGVRADWTTPVRDQGSCGSCWAFSALGSLEAAYKIYMNNPNLEVDFSEQYLVSCAKDDGCNGNGFWKTMDWIMENGCIPESCFPYQAKDASAGIGCDQKCSDWQEKTVHIRNYRRLINQDSTIKNALVLYGPLAAGICMGNTCVNDHMVTIVGYDDQQGYWICKNSWGTNWGENGYFKLYYTGRELSQHASYFSVVFFEFGSSPLIVDIGNYEEWYTVNEEISFKGYAFGGSGDYTWNWNLGDGTTRSSQYVYYEYCQVGTYHVSLTVTDIKGSMSSSEVEIDIRVNSPPGKPVVSFPSKVKNHTEYDCSLSSIDPDEDVLQFIFTVHLPDGNTWGKKTDFYLSGEKATIPLKFGTVGLLRIEVFARDRHGAEGEATEFEVEVTNKTRNKSYVNMLFLQFLENHPILYQLLQRFLRL